MIEKKGIVTGNKQNKTLIVTVHTYKKHPKYKKRYKTSKKYYVHNPENKKFEIGDNIVIQETKPISKLKRWTIKNDKQPTQL